MNKKFDLALMSTTHILILCLATMTGFAIGRFTIDGSLSKKEITTNIVTTEVKKQELQVVQQVQKDSTTVKETTREIISYSPKGKVRKREFVETHYGTKTQIGTQTSLNSVVLDSSFSTKKTSMIESYQSNWLVMLNYQVKLDSWNFDYRNIEMGLGYRLIGSLYGSAQTNTQFNVVKVGGIYVF